MRRLPLLLLIAALLAACQEQPRPAAPPGTGAPAPLACTMTLTYQETVTQLPALPIVRLWKDIDGIATVVCPGQERVRLRLKAGGLSLGAGLPTGSQFRQTSEGFAGSIDLLVPVPIVRKHFEGEYLNVGGEVGGVGAGLSPWVNRDRALNMTLYLPTRFNASAAINIQRLELHLLDSSVDW
jgi:hypothetical protein